MHILMSCQALHVAGVVLELAREYCCEEFAQLDQDCGLKSAADVKRIQKVSLQGLWFSCIQKVIHTV